MSCASETGMALLYFTDHAREAMARRGLSEDEVTAVATAPEQLLDVRPGRVLAQSIRPSDRDRRVYLVRVVLDVWPDGAEVVTAYRTSQITKYWRGVQ